jgi:hypothetical protein
MERQEEGMILDLKESQELCDWLLQRGLCLDETACVLGDLACGDTFAIALLKVFNHRRKNNMEKNNENIFSNAWSNPITL